MRALVPVDETNRRALRIWIAFLDRGLSNEEISGLLEGLFLSIRYFSRRIVASLAALPLPENTDDTFDDPYFEDVSAILHTMWDGMSLQGMMAPGLLSGDGMEVIMRRILNTIALRIQHYLSTNQVKA